MKRVVATILFGYVFLVWVPAEAATVYLDPNTSELRQGDSVTVAVRLDVDEEASECINAIDGVIAFQDGVQPVDVSLGDSIFRVWVEEPTIDTENNRITFAGGIPNGYCGRIEGDPSLTNVIAKLVFSMSGEITPVEGEEPPTAAVTFSQETTAYLNDGQGTRASLRTVPATITLLPGQGGENNAWLDEVAADDIPPAAFSIRLQRYDTAFSGKWYIVFNTTDKQTGIDHYEVIEEPLEDLNLFRFGAADAPWVRTRSPYILRDQSLNSTIRVKAIDNAGNEYIATLVPDESLRTTTWLQVLSAVITLIFLILIVLAPLYLIVRRVRERRAMKRRNSKETTETEALEADSEYDSASQNDESINREPT